MPQLDISAWPPQLVWLAISFVILYIIVSRLIIPKTGGVIEARKAAIASDIAAATAQKGATEAAMKAHDKALAEARAKAGTIAQAARTAADASAAAASAKHDGELAAKAADAEKAISAAREKAVAGLHDVAADVATSIVDQLTGAKITKAAASAAVAKLAN